MAIFERITKGDIEDLKHAIELLDRRTERLQKTQRSGQATHAGYSRRLKAIEAFLKAKVSEEDPEDDDLEDEDEEDIEETPVDRETQRLRVRDIN